MFTRLFSKKFLTILIETELARLHDSTSDFGNVTCRYAHFLADKLGERPGWRITPSGLYLEHSTAVHELCAGKKLDRVGFFQARDEGEDVAHLLNDRELYTGEPINHPLSQKTDRDLYTALESCIIRLAPVTSPKAFAEETIWAYGMSPPFFPFSDISLRRMIALGKPPGRRKR